jgi:hypothetical protein
MSRFCAGAPTVEELVERAGRRGEVASARHGQRVAHEHRVEAVLAPQMRVRGGDLGLPLRQARLGRGGLGGDLLVRAHSPRLHVVVASGLGAVQRLGVIVEVAATASAWAMITCSRIS